MEWKVPIHIVLATGPTRASIRSRIWPAALYVNVIARIENGGTPCSRIRWATRRVRTAVLPLPAPATTSRGPSWCMAASRWAGLRSPSRSASAAALASCSTYRLSMGATKSGAKAEVRRLSRVYARFAPRVARHGHPGPRRSGEESPGVAAEGHRAFQLQDADGARGTVGVRGEGAGDDVLAGVVDGERLAA